MCIINCGHGIKQDFTFLVYSISGHVIWPLRFKTDLNKVENTCTKKDNQTHTTDLRIPRDTPDPKATINSISDKLGLCDWSL